MRPDGALLSRADAGSDATTHRHARDVVRRHNFWVIVLALLVLVLFHERNSHI